MTFWPTLLRVFLCLALLLNGMASAMASTRMAIAHPSHGQKAAEAIAVECHASDPAQTATQAQAVADHSVSGHGSASDCCQANPCACACMVVAPFFAPGALPGSGGYTHDRSMRALASGHTPPTLPHLIRPPIA